MIAEQGCSLAGVRHQARREQGGVTLEPEAKRERNGGTIGVERLIQNEPIRREGFLRHGADQTQCMPSASMRRVRDDAGIDRVAGMRTELTESDDLRPLEQCPGLWRRGVDAAVLPVFVRARRLEGPYELRPGLRKEPHAVRSDRTEAVCGQPTLKRWPDDLARGVAQRSDCRRGEEKFFRDGRAKSLLESSNPFGWRRNHRRVAANEEPDATVAVELRMRRDDDTASPKRRNRHSEKSRPVRVDAFCGARL